MREAVIVEAQRSAIGRGKPGKGALSALHPATLLGKIQRACCEKAGVEPTVVEQIIGGCVTQAGEQAGNVARHAWLSVGDDWTVAGSTVDTQCGSGQQANHIINAMVKSGTIDCGIGCGVEVMSHVGLGANVMNGPGFFLPDPWPWKDASVDQFQAAERIAQKRGITRKDVDELGLASQRKALAAQAENRFAREIYPIEAPVLGEDLKPTGKTQVVDKDQGVRDSTIEGLAALNPVKEGGIHTAGNSSQISDGAAAVLWMTADKARELGLKPRARIVQDVVVGTDPYYLLDGPIDATKAILAKTGMRLSDIDLVEINEAFAAQVIACDRELKFNHARLNVNGGAIALGHPIGCTGARIVTTLLHEMERRDARLGLATLCVSGGLGLALELTRDRARG